jgi:RND family efflux transporter MFP subunit
MADLSAAGRRWRAYAAAALFVGGCALLSLGRASAATAAAVTGEFVTASAQTVTHELRAYGQVEPMALLPVRTVEAGALSGLSVVPGSPVAAGRVLARVGGPQMRSVLTAREQTLRGAQARARAAGRALAIAQSLLAKRLATEQTVVAARNDLAAAQAAEQIAAAQLNETQNLASVRAPMAGTIVAIAAADGEQATAAQTLLPLQPAGRLWLRAEYYGGDAALLQVGMSGTFSPSDGGAPLVVTEAAIAPAIAADGGTRVGLVPASGAAPPAWISGRWGALTLAGPARTQVVVPTQALVLDRGHWWVLVHTDRGNQPQEVVPGPAHGWQTAITSGLKPGQQVVVTDAFLEFHRGVARAYTPPD